MIKKELLKAPLSLEILKTYNALITVIAQTSKTSFLKKQYDGTGGLVSVADLIAYQIGWGSLLLQWYKSGINKENFVMPGDGFDAWQYKEIALHFYQKYAELTQEQLLKKFDETVQKIIMMVEHEYVADNLDAKGVWEWCTLQSGKEWSLSKWVQVNTVAPYKRATALIKHTIKIRNSGAIKN